MNYTSAVSIIPGGCPQFLDCRLDAKSLGRFWAYFREIPQTGESAIASARRQVELVPVPLDDTGQPGDYDYKIDAATGEILGFDYDIEWYTISTTDSDYIGEAKAKQIVEQAAGTTGVYTDFKLEVDDGRVLYEGEMRSGWMEYEFEIDAVTGAIIDWEADWD